MVMQSHAKPPRGTRSQTFQLKAMQAGLDAVEKALGRPVPPDEEDWIADYNVDRPWSLYARTPGSGSGAGGVGPPVGNVP
jgi:hypothetical protein